MSPGTCTQTASPTTATTRAPAGAAVRPTGPSGPRTTTSPVVPSTQATRAPSALETTDPLGVALPMEVTVPSASTTRSPPSSRSTTTPAAKRVRACTRGTRTCWVATCTRRPSYQEVGTKSARGSTRSPPPSSGTTGWATWGAGGPAGPREGSWLSADGAGTGSTRSRARGATRAAAPRQAATASAVSAPRLARRPSSERLSAARSGIPVVTDSAARASSSTSPGGAGATGPVTWSAWSAVSRPAACTTACHRRSGSSASSRGSRAGTPVPASSSVAAQAGVAPPRGAVLPPGVAQLEEEDDVGVAPLVVVGRARR